MQVADVPTPALLLDLDVLEANLRRMARRARELGVRLRPHVKTHKCVQVGELQREAGAEGITVATLEEARAFAAAGFRDLTWAFPVVPGRVEEAAGIARDARLALTVDGSGAVELLEDRGHPFPVWLEVDCGYGRSGVDPGGRHLLEVARGLRASETLTFEGILTHAGQAYHGRSPEELAAAAEEERSVMVRAARRLREAGVPVPSVSVGSTPGMSRAERLDGVDEARPGNYAFHDRTQVVLGACEVTDVALTVLATVISSRLGRDRCVVDAGALALSKDAGPEGAAPPTMGEILDDRDAGRLADGARLVSLSQEHGILSRRLPWGRRVRILPNHSCLTAACHDVYHVVRGDEVVDRWPIHRAR
jgi:D-serine deaminase-like pyridoxal phosphate-dependent protein